MHQELVTRKQVAQHFNVTHETVRNWEKNGLIKPFCTINGRPRYRLDLVLSALTDSKGGATC